MRKVVMTVMAAGLAAVPVGAMGQSASLDQRVTQVEKRLNTVERVLSRQTGGGPLVQPEIGPPDATGAPAGTPATNTVVVQGAIERSNVSGVASMADMIRIERAYQTLAGIMQRQDELRSTAVQKLGDMTA